MKIIVPMAGRGSRLRPHTLTVPKPLVHVAGKPIVHRLVEDIAEMCDDNIEEYNYNGKIRDYTDSMLWYGCGMGMGNDWNQHFYGEFLESYISVKDGYKIFESDFTQLTDYKVFDQSWNGNHLVKFDDVNII